MQHCKRGFFYSDSKCKMQKKFLAPKSFDRMHIIVKKLFPIMTSLKKYSVTPKTTRGFILDNLNAIYERIKMQCFCGHIIFHNKVGRHKKETTRHELMMISCWWNVMKPIIYEKGKKIKGITVFWD